MSVSAIIGDTHACLYCSTTDFAFGPIFNVDNEDINEFIEWSANWRLRMMTDPELENLVNTWRGLTVCGWCEKHTEDILREYKVPANDMFNMKARSYEVCDECWDTLVDDDEDGTDEAFDRQRAEEIGRGEA